MAGPLVILAVVSVLLGFFQHSLEDFLTVASMILSGKAGHHAWLPFVALGLAAMGVILAWVEFGRRGAGQVGFVERIAPLNNLFSQRWYIYRFYRWFLDAVIYGIVSRFCTQNDNKVIDKGLDGLSKAVVATGRFTSLLHVGMIQYRLLAIFVVMVLLAVYFFFQV